jgi:hypothetical protein
MGDRWIKPSVMRSTLAASALILLLLGCQSPQTAQDWSRLWREGNTSQQRRALGWFADYLKPGMTRQQVEELLGEGLTGSHGSAWYFVPDGVGRSQLGVIYEPAWGNRVGMIRPYYLPSPMSAGASVVE